MSTAEEISKLHELKEKGAISEEDYQKAKDALLNQGATPPTTSAPQVLQNSSINPNQWGMFIHLSQLCGFIVPFAGLIIPIVLWQIKKNDSDVIDQHGRIVANWIITALIIGVICFALTFILIGFPLLIALAVLGIVFPIIGGIKANEGVVWPYPMSFKFF